MLFMPFQDSVHLCNPQATGIVNVFQRSQFAVLEGVQFNRPGLPYKLPFVVHLLLPRPADGSSKCPNQQKRSVGNSSENRSEAFSKVWNTNRTWL